MSSRGQHPLSANRRGGIQITEKIPLLSGQRSFHRLQNVLYGSGAHQSIHLRNLLTDFLSVALGQTACRHQCFQAALPAKLRQLQHSVDALLLGISDETAGVHHCRIRLLRVIREFISLPAQDFQHQLRIRKVLVAAQRHKRYFHTSPKILILP